MTDIEMFEESAKWNCDRGFGYKDIHMTCHEAYVIITRLRQAEKDAARYRWLRDNSTTGQSFCGFMIDVDCDGKPSNPFSGIDALIDEAMNASNN